MKKIYNDRSYFYRALCRFFGTANSCTLSVASYRSAARETGRGIGNSYVND